MAHRRAAHHGATHHDKAPKHTTGHSEAHHGTTRRNTARQSRAHRERPRHDTANHGRTQHDAPKHTTTSTQETLTECLSQQSCRTPRKTPHQPATHRQAATPRPATTVAACRHKPPPERESWPREAERHVKTRAPQTPGLTKLPGATAQPSEPEPNPAGKATEPSVYITNLTNGAGARPGKMKAPTATHLTTPNAAQCVHQPTRGRERNRQTPPEKKGGGHEKGPQRQDRPPTPQEAAKPPSQTAPKTGPLEGTPEAQPAQTGDTQRRAAAHQKEGHPEHADTQRAGAETGQKKKTKAQPE